MVFLLHAVSHVYDSLMDQNHYFKNRTGPSGSTD